MIYLILFILTILLFGQCSNPEQGGSIINPIPLPGPDDPSLDTMYSHIDSRIRFEAIIDKSSFPFPRIPDSMRISIVAYIRNDSIPYREIYSASGLYLNLSSAVTIEFVTTIPPNYFWKYNNARLCIGYVFVYVDRNRNKTYDSGEAIYGISEQTAFGYAYGKRVQNIPKDAFQDVLAGPNAFFRIGGNPYSIFKSAPDFDASVFKINMRGAMYKYNVPYPWKPSVPLIP